METFLLWWSIISTVIGILLLVGNVWQYATSRKEKDQHTSQVKIWQHAAGGVQHSLFVIENARFSTVEDFRVAIKALQPSAHSLYQSLYEDRFFDHKEDKQRELRRIDEHQNLLDELRKRNSSDTQQTNYLKEARESIGVERSSKDGAPKNLTEAQVQSISSLLSSFGANDQVIQQVDSVLRGRG